MIGAGTVVEDGGMAVGRTKAPRGALAAPASMRSRGRAWDAWGACL